MKWIAATLLIYFGLRLVYFATNIAPFLPPDEITHFKVSRIFSKVLLFPVDSPETYEHGLVTNIPWLYYWVMGKLLHLNVFGIPDLLFLRLCNIPCAFGTVYFVWRTLRLLTEDRLTQILLIVAMTNTLMFSFLSAAVSYDNLMNLAAATATYYLLAFFKERSGKLLALSLVFQLAGSLTKLTFLPLFLVLNLVLLAREARNIRCLPKAFPAWLKSAGWQGKGLALLVVLGVALNLQLHGGNLLRYRSLEPAMSKVLSVEAAMQNRIHARNTIIALFKEGRVTKDKALEMALTIKTTDRDDLINFIESYDAYSKGKGDKLMSPPEYGMWWLLNIISTVYGIKAHLYMPNNGPMVFLFAALLLLTAIALMVRWRPEHSDAGFSGPLVAISGFYASFILYFLNYATYLDTRVFGITLSGRYLLPVIGATHVIGCYYLLSLFRNGYLRLGFASSLALLFISSDLPFFLLNASPEWFVEP